MTVDCLWLTATDRRSLCDHATTSLRLNVIAVQSLAASATALRFVFYTCDLSTTTGEVSKIWNQSVVLNLRSRFILGLHIT